MTSQAATRSPMVGIHIDDKMRDRLESEQARRIASKRPPNERSLSHICREALDEYLKKQEIMS